MRVCRWGRVGAKDGVLPRAGVQLLSAVERGSVTLDRSTEGGGWRGRLSVHGGAHGRRVYDGVPEARR